MFSNSQEFNLAEIAKQAMLERGFIPEFPPAVLDQLQNIQDYDSDTISFRNEREKLWISIDNPDSKDLDQLTFAEKGPSGNFKLYVAVANVDGYVKKGSEIDKQAYHNTTSVYTPAVIFPMLPLKLSTNLTSLNEGVDRQAVIVAVDISSIGEFTLSETFLAIVHNYQKLDYLKVSDWLENDIPLKGVSQEVHAQLKLQDLIANKILEYRNKQGNLNFETLELNPVMQNDLPVDVAVVIHNRGHRLIENCMIAANATLSKFLESRNIPTLKRVVQVPERWDRIVELASKLNETLPPVPDAKALQQFLLNQKKINPESFVDLSLSIIKLIGRGEYLPSYPGKSAPGHFDLALQDYAHTTAPNRRYPDLIMQRLLKDFLLQSSSSYTDTELNEIARRCTEKENDASKVERHLRKSATALFLKDRIGTVFPALVTGASEKGTWVRLKEPPIEGKLIKGFKGLDVGDHIQVELVDVDVAKGFIDFIRKQ